MEVVKNKSFLPSLGLRYLDNRGEITILEAIFLGLAEPVVKLSVDTITESPKDIAFAEEIGELNLLYDQGLVKDFRFPPVLEVSLVYYRSGRELFFHGRLEGLIEGRCGRCLESYSLPLKKDFDFVLTPEPISARKGELSQDEMGLSFYAAEEINLSPFIREQVLLALPTRPLCAEGCRGLCTDCGVNLNEESCLCETSEGDPRMAFFRSLKLDQ